ncbi:MAG: tRNA (N6-isopentenyl adenosine(37)-C2)-methylthiotransferase MiaB [Candidatus Latescibacteria bacterium]|nr:tRNA (N6-isopentenyl adenosine(37)-C2)-methylthiotransferase MiaB [Candidatus Latescibacterota bacterium]
MTSIPLPLLDEHPVTPVKAGATAAGRPAYIETYGCQMNVADSELVARILEEAGFSIVDRPERAEIVLINTCAVREHAEERVFGRAAQLHGLRAQIPNLTIGILGCMAQHLAKTLPQRAPFVDLVMGPDSYRRLPQLLADTADETLLDVRLSRTENYTGIDPVRREGTNAWVTIIRGCDKFCTFCVVPFVRGRERSVASADIVAQVEKLAAEGFGEVTLLGQTVNSYDDGEMDFAALLEAVSAVKGIHRVRFTSPYPKDFKPNTIAAMAILAPVCPSLHLPVQSASNTQLELMRRGYTIEDYRDLVQRLRHSIPDLALTTDIIVGFCGETDDDFQATCALMEEMRYDSAFMFKYSEREATYAHKHMPDDIPEEIKQQRLQHIIKLQERISLEVNQTWIGRTVEVLVEGPSKRKGPNGANNYGRSPQGKVVVFPQDAAANTRVQIKVERTTSHTLFGDRVD